MGELSESNRITHIRIAEPYRPTSPKLQSLTLHNIDVLFRQQRKLLDLLKNRNDHQIILKRLVLQSCRVPTVEYKSGLKALVGRVTWDNVTEVGSDYESETDETDSEEFDGRSLGLWGKLVLLYRLGTLHRYECP